MLIKTVDELKSYVSSIHKQLSFSQVHSFVEQAEFKYLVPFVGLELLQELEEAHSGQTLTAEQKQLHKFLCTAAAFYAVLDAAPFLALQFGPSGVADQTAGGTGPVRQWSYFNFENAAATNADVFLDMALAFLDKNIGKFQSWKESEAYTQSKSLYINTAAELSRYLNIQNSRRAFIALVPFIQRAEELYIIPALGEDLHEGLKESMLGDGQYGEERTKLLRLLKPALAQYTLIEAIPEISFTVAGSGFKLLAENDGIKQRLGISKDERNEISVAAQRRADQYMRDLRTFLDKMLQEGETDPADNQQAFKPFDNTQSSPIFFVG